jgi:hypothetical protein
VWQYGRRPSGTHGISSRIAMTTARKQGRTRLGNVCVILSFSRCVRPFSRPLIRPPPLVIPLFLTLATDHHPSLMNQGASVSVSTYVLFVIFVLSFLCLFSSTPTQIKVINSHFLIFKAIYFVKRNPLMYYIVSINFVLTSKWLQLRE